MNQIKCYICDQLVICNSIKAIHFATKSDTIHKSNNYQIFLYNLRHPLIPNKVAVKAAHNSHSILPVEHQQGHTTVQPLHWGLYTGASTLGPLHWAQGCCSNSIHSSSKWHPTAYVWWRLETGWECFELE